MQIVSSLQSNLGSFAVNREYLVIGYGVSNTEGRKTSLNVFNTTQERFKEISGTQVHYIGKDAIEHDLSPLYEGPFMVVVTDIYPLPIQEVNKVYDIFVYAEAYADSIYSSRVGERIVHSACSLSYPNKTWEENLDIITTNIYNDLKNQMSMKMDVDMLSFGVDFNSFSVHYSIT